MISTDVKCLAQWHNVAANGLEPKFTTKFITTPSKEKNYQNVNCGINDESLITLPSSRYVNDALRLVLFCTMKNIPGYKQLISGTNAIVYLVLQRSREIKEDKCLGLIQVFDLWF